MAQNNQIPQSKINDAAGGNQALRDILKAAVSFAGVQSLVTNTGNGAAVPAQASASVSYLEKNYIVQIQNPGAVSPTSALQAAQAAANATSSTSLAPVRAIYHQIRYASTPGFNVASGVTVLGGDTGSTQTYWTLSGLGSGRFYFQIRSSYDGTNWNLWRNANGGQSITKGVEGVTLEQVTNAVWAAFTLPGDQLCAFGSGFVGDQGSFDPATNLYTSAMQVIPGPNGFDQTGNLAHGIRANQIAIQTPSDTSGTVGPPDYPTLVNEKYEDGEGHVWSGSANIWGFAYDPLGTNVTLKATNSGVWVVFTLPGGAKMAIGTGTVPNGTVLDLPAGESWAAAGAPMLSLVTSANAFSGDNHAHGVNQANIDPATLTVTATWRDGEGNVWPAVGVGLANWFAIRFSAGVPLAAVGDGKFVTFTLPTGTKVAIGAGVTASGSSFTLPAGFTADKSLSMGVPVSFNDIGHAMAGVSRCAVSGTTCTLAYQDGAANYWDGNVGWMIFAWQ